MDSDQPFIVHNDATHSIRVFLNDDMDYKAVYPDTSITNFKERLSIEILPGTKEAISGSGEASWDNVFEVSIPNDTLSVFILHSDTIKSYSWDSIRNQYNVLIRYDLSLNDLKNRNFELKYPYDPTRGELKVWPK